MSEQARMARALRRYEAIQPLDLLTGKQIAEDIRSIAGDEHLHRRMIASDECLLCGHDRDHPIHTRAEQ